MWPSGFIAVHAVLILVCLPDESGYPRLSGGLSRGGGVGWTGRCTRRAHGIMTNFALSFFAPIYFISMGLTTNYMTHFDWTLVLVMLTAALVRQTCWGVVRHMDGADAHRPGPGPLPSG